jgi:hypothetical protein
VKAWTTIFDARPGWAALAEVLTRSGTRMSRRAFILAAGCMSAAVAAQAEAGPGGALSYRVAMFTRKVSSDGGECKHSVTGGSQGSGGTAGLSGPAERGIFSPCNRRETGKSS